MSFMQHQVTHKQRWIRVETSQGTEFLPTDLVGDLMNSEYSDESDGVDRATLQQYCEGTVESWESLLGYGARLSAPGYMDCTEWAVFDTAEEAEDYLKETYPEDEDDE